MEPDEKVDKGELLSAPPTPWNSLNAAMGMNTDDDKKGNE